MHSVFWQILPFSTAMCMLSAIMLHLPAPQKPAWPQLGVSISIQFRLARKSAFIYFMIGVPTVLGCLSAARTQAGILVLLVDRS